MKEEKVDMMSKLTETQTEIQVMENRVQMEEN
jgi:hypothetical protein